MFVPFSFPELDFIVRIYMCGFKVKFRECMDVFLLASKYYFLM